MSLLSENFEQFAFINALKVDDGEGGQITTYEEGASFTAVAVLDSSMTAKIGQALGVTGLYTITTPRATTLEFHDVVKRKSDGKIFRVTSDGDDNKTPKGAGLDMRQVSAEEWRIPKS